MKTLLVEVKGMWEVLTDAIMAVRDKESISQIIQTTMIYELSIMSCTSFTKSHI